MKQDNVLLKQPLECIKNPDGFNTFKIVLPNGEQFGWLEPKQLTTKNGKCIAVLKAIADKFKLETVGDVQPKTQKAIQKETERLDKLAKEEKDAKASAKIAVFSLTLGDRISKVDQSKREKTVEEIKNILSLNINTLSKMGKIDELLKR